MLRKAPKNSGLVAVHPPIPPTTRQTGTKESPILLFSDDESEGEQDVCPSLAATQKIYLGVSPSNPYSFKGHGSAYDIMIAMGYTPDHGLGPDLRGNVQPLPIELRKPSAGVGYRTTSVSRSPSPAPPPKKAPVKIIRPPKEPVASTSKIEQPAVKVALQTKSRSKARPETLTLLKSPKKSTPVQQSLPPLTALSPPPPSPVPFVPSDLYISLMSGLAMANIPQAMQVTAAADPMAAFQLAQMCFAPPSPFPLPPFSLLPPKPDPTPVKRGVHTPNLPPKPVSNFITKYDPKISPVLPPAPSSVLQETNLITTPPSASTDYSSVTIEMDPFVLKQKRQARKNSIGWIPEPGFLGRGTFDLVPTIDYVHWSSSDGVTPPDPQRSLVMEDLPCDCRTVKFVRSWADRFPATAVYLNGNAKALVEFPSKEVAEVAYDSPRLRGGPFKRATHVRVFWYRPQAEDVVPSLAVTTNGNVVAAREVEDVPEDEPVFMAIDGLDRKAETTEIGKGAQLEGKEKRSPLPLTEPDPPDVDLSVSSPTVPASTQRSRSPSAATPFMACNKGKQGRQPGSVDRDTLMSQERSEHGTLRPPLSPPSVPPMPCAQVPSHPRSPPPEVTQRKRTPPGSPPSLRYPSSSPETTNEKERASSPSEETSMCDTQSPTSTSDPSSAGSYFLEQQLRMRLLAVKGARIANRSCGQTSSSSTPSTIADNDSDTFFKTTSLPPVSGAPENVAMSESLELLATSFITDTIQAAQGSPNQLKRSDTTIETHLGMKREFSDAFEPSSADIAFKRQRLAQRIEETKKVMERWKTAKTKGEKDRIYASWEELNRPLEPRSRPAPVPFQWPCYAEKFLIVDADSEDDEDMELS